MTERRIDDQFDPTRLLPIEGVLDLSSVGQMSHLIDPVTNQEYLLLEDEEHVPYPVPNEEDIIDYLLLPTTIVECKRYLHLPTTYRTFTQALETIATDAVDEATSPENAIARGAVLSETKTLFDWFGNQLDDLVLGDSVIPEDMHIRQVLVAESGEGLQMKLLPPLRVRSIEDEVYSPVDARTIILQQLYNSCWNAVTSQTAKDTLPAAFKGFAESFSFGRDLLVSRTLGKSSLHDLSAEPHAV